MKPFTNYNRKRFAKKLVDGIKKSLMNLDLGEHDFSQLEEPNSSGWQGSEGDLIKD